MANNFEIVLDPDSWIPDATAHPNRAMATDRPYWGFDDTTVETLYSRQFQMPAGYAGTGTLKIDVQYMMASATTGSIDMEVSVEAVTPGDAQDLTGAASFDAVNGGNETVPGTAGHLGHLTITLSNKDSVAAGDFVRLKLERDSDDATNDTATGDLRFLGAVLYEEAA